MEGARGRYLDYFLHFRGLESKRGNVKPSYLIEIHSEIATLFHILVHYRPDRYEICCIVQTNEGGQRPDYFLHFRALKGGNVKPSYL